MKILITGISGHIGPHLTKILIAKAYQVHGLVRKQSNLRSLQGLDVKLFCGDILDAPSLRSAGEGCQWIFHLAAPTTIRTSEDRIAILDGIKNVLSVANNSKTVEKIVYVSSTVTVGVVNHVGETLDESSFVRLTGTPYQQAKWEAEHWLQEQIKTTNAPVVIVKPSTIVGSGDWRPTPPNRLVVDFMNASGNWDWLWKLKFKEAPVWFKTGFSVVHVEDVAQGIFLAAQKGRLGEQYILSGDNITYAEMYRTLASLLSLPRPYIYLPKPIMYSLSWFLERCMEHPPMSYSLARAMVNRYAFFSSKKAKQELGYSWRNYKESLADAAKWFLETPLINEKRKSKLCLHYQ